RVPDRRAAPLNLKSFDQERADVGQPLRSEESLDRFKPPSVAPPTPSVRLCPGHKHPIHKIIQRWTAAAPAVLILVQFQNDFGLGLFSLGFIASGWECASMANSVNGFGEMPTASPLVN